MPAHLTRATLAAVAIAGLTPAAAWADPPDRSTTLGAGALTYAWSGDATPAVALFSVPTDDPAPFCSKEPTNYCDLTLFKVEQPGELVVSMPDGGDGQTHDFDLALYKASSGGIASHVLASSASAGGAETATATELTPGHYLAIIVYTISAGQEAPSATATLTPSGPAPSAAPVTPPAAVTMPAPDAVPASAIGRIARAVRAKRLKRFAGTASDDGAVAGVEIALTRAAGSRCRSLTASGRWRTTPRTDGRCAPAVFLPARGTTRWSFTLRRRLARGSYTLHSRATDGTGQVEAPFGARNRRSFRVR